MNRLLRRLRDVERWWLAEIALRAVGTGLLYAFAVLACSAHRPIGQPRQHDAGPQEFIIAALAFACLSAGLALLIEGPGLFRPVPLPPRPMQALL